jgi:aspartate racemase
MKTIGIIGGTSWVSTVDYYKLINELTHKKLGGSHAARLILYSVNFHEIKQLLDQNDWKSIADIYIDIANKLKDAGAECIVLAANTAHRIADEVQQAVPLPLIHIADATAEEISKQQVKKVALLGTKFVMENAFFKDRLSSRGIETMIPNDADREFIHSSIFNELTRNIFTEDTKQKYLALIEKLTVQGAEGIIYACTEIPILLLNEQVQVKTFDTTVIHATAAVAFATEG